jgi:hypothetical protein
MKFMMMISIVAIVAHTADAQYFNRGRVYARQDFARDSLLVKYIETKWLYAAPISPANIETPIESPIVNKRKLPGYRYSSERQPGTISTWSIDKASKHYREKPWLGMYLRPLVEFAYSLYEPNYTPNGN